MNRIPSMRSILANYHKYGRLSVGRFVPGVPYRPRRPTTPDLGSRRPTSNVHHDLYGWPNTHEYHPRLNSPAVQMNEYESYDPADADRFSHFTDPRLFRNLDNTNLPEDAPPEFIKGADEVFLQLMQERYESYRDAAIRDETSEDGMPECIDEHLGETLDTENLPEFSDVIHALGQLQTVLPNDHPDIINLRQAMHHMLEHPENLPQPEDFGVFGGSKLGQGDPYENDPMEEAEQAFDQQMQLAEQMFEGPGFPAIDDQMPDIFDQQQAQLEMMIEAFEPEDPFGQQGLEEILEQANMFDEPLQQFSETEMMPDQAMMDMANPQPEMDAQAFVHEEINQAMEQAIEPWNAQLQKNPMEEQELQDPYMQQFNNPYQMPGQIGFGTAGPLGPILGPGM